MQLEVCLDHRPRARPSRRPPHRPRPRRVRLPGLEDLLEGLVLLCNPRPLALVLCLLRCKVPSELLIRGLQLLDLPGQLLRVLLRRETHRAFPPQHPAKPLHVAPALLDDARSPALARADARELHVLLVQRVREPLDLVVEVLDVGAREVEGLLHVDAVVLELQRRVERPRRHRNHLQILRRVPVCVGDDGLQTRVHRLLPLR
mmetsp:Transcript_892/g.2153  ORF Transcript_892/g.2153 Transcript_892/m.2153 type:complete len:203 (-) Transcript_892:2131-2739(-)